MAASPPSPDRSSDRSPSPSSDRSPNDATPSLAVAAAAAAAAAAPAPSSRRVPPPCWSVEETLALIDSYQEKWYSLRRGNLRAPHWQEVADAVSRRCNRLPSAAASTPKTAVQCRHKIEKLRKRYRSERGRSLRGNPTAPPASPWVFFRKMESMERGSAHAGTGAPAPARASPRVAPPSPPSLSASMSGDASSSSGEFPVVMANGKSVGGNLRPTKGIRSKMERVPNNGREGRLFGGYAAATAETRPSGLVEMRRRVEKKRSREVEGGSVGKVADALRMMCDGFMRMEQMKMDMVSEIHKLRMEMELKRTEMMLDSQRRIIDSFLEGIVRSRRAKVSHEM